MRWILFGALLGLLLLIPSALPFVGAVAAWLLGKPALVAFVLGVIARPYLPQLRRWAR